MIKVETSNPQDLITKINNAITDKHVLTWTFDTDGDYSPVQDQWIGKAWMTPVVRPTESGVLYFGIIESKKYKLTKSVYGVFHGRFAEMLLTHFDNEITSLYISPLLVPDVDIFEKSND